MIFRFLGQVIRRAWVVLLLIWALIIAGTWYAAPSWDQVARDKEFAFLPEDVPSRRAEEVFAKAFPDDRLASNIVLVLYRKHGAPEKLRDDLKFIDDAVEPGLRRTAAEEGGLASEVEPSDGPLFSDDTAPPPRPKKRSIIYRIHTPNAPGIGSLLMSQDGQALLVVLELTTEFLSTDNWPTIKKVENLIHDLHEEGKVPAGLDVAMTGSAVLGRDHTLAELRSVDATRWLTVVLVVGLLLLIYRAPLLALIPLCTVYLAVQVGINLLAILAQAGHITLFQGIQIYIIILAYGAGIDYCIFLMARYKEELDRGMTAGEAIATAMGSVGAALVASAGTVMCGIAMMMFAEFGKFRQAGAAIPLALAVVLLATLTFTPSLLRLAGCWAFWPERYCGRISTGAHPHGWLSRFGLHESWDKVGHLLLRRAGGVWLGTVALMAPFAIAGGLLYNHLDYGMIDNLPADSPSVVGTEVLQQHFPAGIIGPLTVVIVHRNVNFDSTNGRSLVKELTDRLAHQKEKLGLADVRSLTAPLGIGRAPTNPLWQLDVPADVREKAIERAARERYVTDMGERGGIGTRLDLVLRQSPFSQQSVRNLEVIEQTVTEDLPADIRNDAQVYFVGPTASVRDMTVVMQHDRRRIEILVLLSVFVILVLLLREVMVPIYLLLSVLFSYYTTLGVSFAVFWMLDPHGFTGIDWKVAIFLFTILIAVGEDYNIFLITRIHEEQKRHGPITAITEALGRTGPIISSCGIIMAGTFAALMAGSLAEMKQLGFALAFGVLLDTFVVRPILLPSFLVLLRRKQGAE